MATRLPASHRTREDLTSLIEGRLSTGSAKDELVKLATRLIVEEALEGEAGDAVGRNYYAHGAQPGQGYPQRLSNWSAEDGRGIDGIFRATDCRS
jgi:putative transposase